MDSSSAQLKEMLDHGECNDFLRKYQNINNKLKKRFMRNPNVAEASEQFISLANQCEQEEIWQYAGLCCLAAARCYHTLGNITNEINYLVKGGKYFLLAHEQSKKAGCPSVGLDDLQAASSCFSDVARHSENEPEFKVMAAGSIMKLALAVGPTPAGGQLLRKSIGVFPTLQAIDTLVLYCIQQDDYSTALTVVNELMELIQAVHSSSEQYRHFLRKAEITRLFLILMLQRTSQHNSPFSEILERYALTEDNWHSVVNFNEDEFLLLQSLVLACQSQDTETLVDLEGHLWQYLDAEQKQLLRTLVRVMINE